jgi:hypothetical protein
MPWDFRGSFCRAALGHAGSHQSIGKVGVADGWGTVVCLHHVINSIGGWPHIRYNFA